MKKKYSICYLLFMCMIITSILFCKTDHISAGILYTETEDPVKIETYRIKTNNSWTKPYVKIKPIKGSYNLTRYMPLESDNVASILK